MSKLLIIDDEPNVLYSLQSGLESDDLAVIAVQTGKRGLAEVQSSSPDVVIVDLRLPDLTGLELVDHIKKLDPRLPVILITAFSTTETAIEAIKRGAFEYLLKPVDLHQLRVVVGKALELRRMQSVPAVFDDTQSNINADQIVGKSPAMQEIYKAIGRLATQDVTVLILGESGTGKELIARALYQHGNRAEKPFLAINCAAIPEALLESELFGHEKGAFTGADRKRIGKFEQANEGTLFLDEIGDMSAATQAKVLRLLQDQRFERIGGQETTSTNVRLIAATNQNLDAMVAAGRFRQDLLYRLNGVTIHLPALRERTKDIPLLVQHFLRLSSIKLGKHVTSAAEATLHLLEAHPWPGNIRELQNVIRYGVLQASGDVLTVDCLPAYLQSGSAAPLIEPSSDLADLTKLVKRMLEMGTAEIYRRIIGEVDRVILLEVLRHVAGNQVQASELLGISRTTLRTKLGTIQVEG